VKLDGSNPTLLYGYASYGITEEPFFSPSRLAWMDQGGVFAIANPRGSSDFGRQWHEDGKQATKPNTWRDFIACAEYLIAQKWTRPAKLGIWGGSAGGILVGRAMTERPELFAVVVPEVGSLDMVRMETTPNGVPNIPEFGSRTTETGFRALLAMSTYHQIKDGVAYPAVLLVHGVNDPRVEVWNSTKVAARLLAVKPPAGEQRKPVLLRLDYVSGHGMGSTKSQALDSRADTFAFLLWQMGVPGFEQPVQRLFGLTREAGLFELARNNMVMNGQLPGLKGDFRGAEWAGACFSPNGRTLFANVYPPGFSVAISGPFV
jgi:prolyl oligopeptidase